jgi:hypothetical protein
MDVRCPNKMKLVQLVKDVPKTVPIRAWFFFGSFVPIWKNKKTLSAIASWRFNSSFPFKIINKERETHEIMGPWIPLDRDEDLKVKLLIS